MRENFFVSSAREWKTLRVVASKAFSSTREQFETLVFRCNQHIISITVIEDFCYKLHLTKIENPSKDENLWHLLECFHFRAKSQGEKSFRQGLLRKVQPVSRNLAPGPVCWSSFKAQSVRCVNNLIRVSEHNSKCLKACKT